jgi:hypothetical protein
MKNEKKRVFQQFFEFSSGNRKYTFFLVMLIFSNDDLSLHFTLTFDKSSQKGNTKIISRFLVDSQ